MTEDKDQIIKKTVVPYAPTGSVLSVVRRYREYGTPKTIDATEIQRVGVSEGNTSRTLAALKFLGLTENDRPTDKFTMLNKATTEEYPKVLGDIIRDAYSDIFAILNPKTATEVQIIDAFRGKEPDKQRARMVQLFTGLCQEAGIMEGKPTVVAGRKYAPPSSTSSNGSDKKRQQQDPIQNPPKNPDYWDIKFSPYLEDLPPSEKRVWKKSKRDKWITAVTAMLDYLIDIEDENS
jgi:uncharacterized protein DUF5343